MKALSLLLLAGLTLLTGCNDPEAEKANAMLIRASAAIKTPLQLDQYTTLVKVSVPELLLQEFVYEVTDVGIPLLESKFPQIQKDAVARACMRIGHVVKYNGRDRFVWQNAGRVLREVIITKADCSH